MRASPFWERGSHIFAPQATSESRGRLFDHALVEAVFLHLAIERRAADAETAGDFRHLAAIMREREADRFRLQFLEPAHVAVRGRAAAAHSDRGSRRARSRARARDRRRATSAGTGGTRTSKPSTCAAICGNSRDRQLVAVGEHHGAKDGVFELAHIAGPVVARQQRQRLGGQAANVACPPRRRSARRSDARDRRCRRGARAAAEC